MRIDEKFRTLHELADFLVQLGKTLKQMPDMDLKPPSKGKPKSEKEPLDKKWLNELTDKLPNIGREEAEKRLSELSFRQLKLIAGSFKIPVGERKNKKHLIKKILFNLYDFKAGHELLRNFSSEET